MQPHPPPRPEPSFLEREFVGIPIFIHLMATVVSCGLWLLALLIVIPIDAVKRRVDRVVDPIVDRLFDAVFNVLTWPLRRLYRWLKS